MRKLRTWITLLAMMVFALLSVPQNELFVSAAEQKTVGTAVCQCGYRMDVYTRGMSGEEYETWRAHAAEHLKKGESADYDYIVKAHEGKKPSYYRVCVCGFDMPIYADNELEGLEAFDEHAIDDLRYWDGKRKLAVLRTQMPVMTIL